MKTLWAKQALLKDGWARDVAIKISNHGRIASVARNVEQTGLALDILLPAPANCHSHAFQRAMAGLAEKRSEGVSDSFWTWRKLMYRFLDQLTPDHVQAIAAFVQMEMLEAGFGSVAEFHYLHHQPDGSPYTRLSEMADRIAAASTQTGIGLAMLPVQYQFGGCDQRALGAGQLRFGNNPDQFERLVSDVRDTMKSMPPDSILGIAPHSLRAVAPEQLRDAPELAGNGPIHIHIAEQKSEVKEVLNTWGARPVQWAIENLPVDQRWCMVHATQMLPSETIALAKTGAVAGLCPITESNLGDGIFDGVRWMNSEGKIALGSDSNILISIAEEMRVLDNSQRLRDNTRAALASVDASTGRRIFEAACIGGAQSSARGSGEIAVGEWADLLSLDMTHVDLTGLRGDTVLDSFAVCGNNSVVSNVWSAGRHMVVEGHHINHEAITAAYRNAVAELRAGL